MQYRPLNVNQEVSKTNHSGSVSDSLDRLAAVSECMASVKKLDIIIGYNNVLKLDTALTDNTLTKLDIGKGAVIPPHLAPGRLIRSSVDNIDINDGTLRNIHAKHYATSQR